MKFSVDPWDPGYGASLGAELGRSAADVDVAVEVPAARWAPIDPPGPGHPAPDAVLFVDGVRRVDAQVWVDDAQESLAVCASYAAGVVCSCAAEGAHLVGGDVRRGLFTTSAEASDIVTAAGRYTAVRTAPRSGVAPAQVLSSALQLALSQLEEEIAGVARARTDGGSDLLVVDGPLGRRQHLPRTIGFAKSHRSTYLPAALGEVVARLEPGQRTPVFALSAPRDLHTWYLRLPGADGAPWAGIVRVEAAADQGSVELAALSQATLVRYASTEYKDSRAPQNLYPIAGLERALRRRLGEPALMYRALRRAAVTELQLVAR